MREKLIELFRAVAHENCFGSIENIADPLIANGVTLQSRDCYWATEQAYKNGYEQGKKDAVKHSQWVKSTTYPIKYICPVCGHLKDFKKPYCEICGTKMDGDVK